MAKVDELEEELNVKMKLRNQHGRIFDETDLGDMAERCKITGMKYCLVFRFLHTNS